MKLKQQIIRTLVAWGALGVFMVLFEPSRLPVVVLIVPFLLLFLAFYNLWNTLNLLRVRYFVRQTRQPSRRLGLTVCGSAVLLIVLQSLGQLTLRDVVTVIAIVAVGYTYLSRSLSQSPKR